MFGGFYFGQPYFAQGSAFLQAAGPVVDIDLMFAINRSASLSMVINRIALMEYVINRTISDDMELTDS
jgi:hypothetical protein